MASWNMKRLVEFCNVTFGKPKGELVSNVLVSLMWKLNLVRYHADESKEAITRLLGDRKDVDPTEIVDLILEQGSGSEKGKSFYRMQFAAEANLIACAQSLHSMADIFGQVIYISLDLDNTLPKPIPKRMQYLHAVNDCMKKNSIGLSITMKLDELLESQEYCYLKDFMNVTKHRSLVPARYTVTFGAEALHGLQISRFSYDGRDYETKWSDDFLNKDVFSVQQKIIEAGILVNESLGIN
jgi:hypothetical protein